METSYKVPGRTERMIVRHCMSSKVISIEPQRTIAEARDLLARHKFRQLPVVRGGKLIGIVTDRDLRSAGVRASVVRDVMTPTPLVIGTDAPVDEAARILRAKKINALPVTEKRKLVGVLTASDVLDAFVDLSGVTEPTSLLVVDTPAGKRSEEELRKVVAKHHGEVKWLWIPPRRPREMHVRLKARRLGDIETALEAAGFDVMTVIRPQRRTERP